MKNKKYWRSLSRSRKTLINFYRDESGMYEELYEKESSHHIQTKDELSDYKLGACLLVGFLVISIVGNGILIYINS